MTDLRTRFLALVSSHFGVIETSAEDPLDALIIEELKPDELDMIELAMAFEDGFDIQITDDELEPFTPSMAHSGKTLRDMLALVEAKVAGKAEA